MLIDTPGCDPFDPGNWTNFGTRRPQPDAAMVLVLPAGLDPAEATDLALAYAAAGANLLVATRLDLARRLGGILAASAGARLALTEAGHRPRTPPTGCCRSPPGWLATRTARIPCASEPRRMTTGRIIAVASGKGGVGKTWFAITLPRARPRTASGCCCSTATSALPMSTSSSA